MLTPHFNLLNLYKNEINLIIFLKKAFQINERLNVLLKWSHLGSNQGPPDYESGALTS